MPHPFSAKGLKVDPKNTECLIKLGHKIKARDNEGRGSQGSWPPETMPLKWEPQKWPHECTLPWPRQNRGTGTCPGFMTTATQEERLVPGDIQTSVLNDTASPHLIKRLA